MNKKHDNQYGFKPSSKWLSRGFDVSAMLLLFLFVGLFLYAFQFLPEAQVSSSNPKIARQIEELVEDGIHLKSGLIVDKGYQLILNNCGACHSYKLVTQNSASAEGWTETIRWMQATQKLWDLGENEALIVAYLAKNYGVKKASRRLPLDKVEWYEL